MTLEKRLSIQQAQVREAVKQFRGCTVRELAERSLIPRAVFHRRLIELERGGYVAKVHGSVRACNCCGVVSYYPIPLQPDKSDDIEELTVAGDSCNGSSSTR